MRLNEIAPDISEEKLSNILDTLGYPPINQIPVEYINKLRFNYNKPLTRIGLYQVCQLYWQQESAWCWTFSDTPDPFYWSYFMSNVPSNQLVSNIFRYKSTSQALNDIRNIKPSSVPTLGRVHINQFEQYISKIPNGTVYRVAGTNFVYIKLPRGLIDDVVPYC